MLRLIIHTTLMLVLLSSYEGFSQSLEMYDVTAEEAANILVDPEGGVEILDAWFFGEAIQIGGFSNGLNAGIGMDEGIMLTTGKRTFAELPPGTNSRQEPTSDGLIPSLSMMFRAGGKEAQFEFVFASMEYPGFVHTEYNDWFKLSASGPGIPGPGMQNFALIPNTEIEVSINTVNGGTSLTVIDGDNDEYFVSNYTPVGTHDIVYFGYTTVITVTIPTHCDEVYTLKANIANVQDANYDSAVFLKANSLRSEYQIRDLSVSPNPACEGDPITLSVDAQPDPESYFFEWSTGQSGYGLDQITVPAVIGQDYSVTVDPGASHCTFQRSEDVTVHQESNVAPTTTGVNGTGENMAYFQAGQPNCFTIQTTDSPWESVMIDELIQGLPNGMTYEINQDLQQQSVEFCWTPGVHEFGEYTFELNYSDNSACGPLGNTNTILIRVVCPSCPLHITYNDRLPNSNPLPPLTEAGEWIKAGLDGPVEVGEEQVIFRAPTVVMGGNFVSGPNFIADNEPSCLDEDCDECCEHWNGFTFEDPGDEPTITPDGDYCNEVWYLRDTDHPVGAFGAVGFRLTVYSAGWGGIIYRLEEQPGYCHPFFAPGTQPAPCPVSEPQPYSSIYWPGIINDPTEIGYGCYVNDGLYPYTVELMSPCDNSYTHVLGGSIRVLNSPGPGNCNPVFREAVEPELETGLLIDDAIALYPNPNSGSFTISGPEMKLVQVYDISGKKVTERSGALGSITNIEGLDSGIYIVRVSMNDGTVDNKKVIVN